MIAAQRAATRPVVDARPGRHVTVHTDGSCKGNPGPGGYGVVIRSERPDAPTKMKELTGGETHTTNNRMELMGPIAALEWLGAKDRPITITSDSRYVVDGMTGWLDGWKAKGWKTSNGEPVQNRDLWERLDEATRKHGDVQWLWVRGHAGNEFNEKAHALAGKAADRFARKARKEWQ